LRGEDGRGVHQTVDKMTLRRGGRCPALRQGQRWRWRRSGYKVEGTERNEKERRVEEGVREEERKRGKGRQGGGKRCG